MLQLFEVFIRPCMGIVIAVNWYLSKNDLSNDGNIRGYLTEVINWICDSDLFDVLKRMWDQNRMDVKPYYALVYVSEERNRKAIDGEETC